MIQLYARNVVYVGITALNVEKLTRGLPLRFPLARAAKDIVILYGPSKIDIVRQLEEAGVEIPPLVRQTCLRDPH